MLDFACSLHFLQPFMEGLEFLLGEGVYGTPRCCASFLEFDFAVIVVVTPERLVPGT